jgi:hypothetical protein
MSVMAVEPWARVSGLSSMRFKAQPRLIGKSLAMTSLRQGSRVRRTLRRESAHYR